MNYEGHGYTTRILGCESVMTPADGSLINPRVIVNKQKKKNPKKIANRVKKQQKKVIYFKDIQFCLVES